MKRLREERRTRVLAGMAEAGLDALVLGTAANIRYATGASPLWLAGTRPFAPLAVVRADGEIFLVANSDDAIPPEIDPGHVLPASWNPMTIMERLAGVVPDGTIGVDGLSPMFGQLLSSTFPNAQLDDATPVLHRVRATKIDDELALMRQAAEICASASAVVTADLVGRTERQLHAHFMEQIARQGITVPAFDGTFCVVDDRPLRRFPSDRTVEPGDRVVLDVGVMVNGYEGGLARTWIAGQGPDTSADDAMSALVEACRPGVTHEDLAAAAPNQDLPVAYGVGLGVEPLVIEVGSTLCLQVHTNATLRRDTLVLRPEGPELLSRLGS